MLKWKLMVTTLPFVVGVTALKMLLEWGLGFGGVVDFNDVGVVLTAGVFLTGFMLAGTMSDYKESEKLPGELACNLEAVEEVLVQATAAKPQLPVAPLRAAVLEVAEKLREFLVAGATASALFDQLTRLHGVIQQLERDGGGAYASRAVSELNNLRRNVTRLHVIRQTGFLPPAYALLDTLLVLILSLVLVAKYKSPLAMGILVPFLTLIYVYMNRLIRDIDNPFDYAADGTRRGGAEVDLFPLEDYLRRLRARAQP